MTSFVRNETIATGTDGEGREFRRATELVTVGRANTVHAGTVHAVFNKWGEVDGQTYATECGAEFGKGGRGKKSYASRAHRSEEQVTCINCAKA